MLSVARAVVSLVNDDSRMQALQINLLKREIREDVERFQEYGFTSKPHPGAEAVVVFVGGNRDHGLCIAVDDRRYRVKPLADGEVAVYSDEGDRIHFKRNRVIEVTTHTFRVHAETLIELNAPRVEVNASDEFAIDSPLTTSTGELRAEGDISDRSGSAEGSSMDAMRGVFDGHTHTETGSVTQAPTQKMEP
jgi:phage baseplate assembly protein V